MAIMARAGRKRRIGVERGAGGEIKTAAKNAERKARGGKEWRVMQVAQAQRAKMIVDALIKDQRLSTPLGQMLLLGSPRAISAQVFAAGEHALKVLNAYDRVVLGVHRTPAGQSLDGGGRSVGEPPTKEQVEDATKQFMRVERALGAARMPGCASAVKRLLRGEQVTLEQVDLAVLGLKSLAKEFGFDAVNAGEAHRAAMRHRFIGEDNLAEAVALDKAH
jgi:hypothetical protein